MHSTKGALIIIILIFSHSKYSFAGSLLQFQVVVITTSWYDPGFNFTTSKKFRWYRHFLYV